MAQFETANYETDKGVICSLRVDKADLAVEGNSIPGGVPVFKAYNRRAPRKRGLSVRRAILKRELRPADEAKKIPAQYAIAYVTVLTPAAMALIAAQPTTTYAGQIWKYSDEQPENA